MHADTAQQGDIGIAHAGALEFPEQSGDEQVIRAGARHIRKDDADAIAGTRHLRQRRRTDGMGERCGNRRRHVADGVDHLRLDHDGAHGRGNSEFNFRFAKRHV